MKVFRKSVSLLLALILALSIFTIVPFAASATEGARVVFFTQPRNSDGSVVWQDLRCYSWMGGNPAPDWDTRKPMTYACDNSNGEAVYYVVLPGWDDFAIFTGVQSNDNTEHQTEDINYLEDGAVYQSNDIFASDSYSDGKLKVRTVDFAYNESYAPSCEENGRWAFYDINSNYFVFNDEGNDLIKYTSYQEFEDNIVIPAAGHNFSDPVWAETPEYNEDTGLFTLEAVFTCTSYCGQDYSVTGECTNIDTTVPDCGYPTYRADFECQFNDMLYNVSGVEWTGTDYHHTLVNHPAVPATLTTDGNIEYWQCSVCEKYFSDAEGENEISYNDTIIPATAAAVVNNTTYGTFAEAMAARTSEDDVITLLKNVEGDVTLAADETLCVSLNGFTVNVITDAANYNIETTVYEGVTVYAAVCEFYLAGVDNNWTVDADYRFHVNPANPSEFMLDSLYIPSGSGIKVVRSENGADIDAYYPPSGGNYNINDSGFYSIYFKPEGNVEGWFGGYFYVDRVNASTIGRSVSMKDEIAYNLFAFINTDRFPGFTATYTYTDGTTVSAETEAYIEEVDPETYLSANYKLVCMIPPKAMADDITIKVLDAQGDTVVLSYTESIAHYATSFAGVETIAPVACAMLDYGAACQEYFSYNTDNLANRVNSEIDPDWVTPDPESFGPMIDTTKVSRVKKADFGYQCVGSSMTAAAKTKIRLYFEKDDELAEGTVITINGEEVVPFKNNSTRGYYCVDITGIASGDIFNDYTLTFTKNGASETIVYNALNYYRQVMKSDDLLLQNAVKAMYIYSKEAASLNVVVSHDQ